MTRPYVVSGDMRLLLQRWAERKKISLPATPFFRALRRDFRLIMNSIFNPFDFVEEDELKEGLTALAQSAQMPTVSLDRVYCRCTLNLDFNRLVDEYGNDLGAGPRPGMPSLAEQLEQIRSANVAEVALIDDVIFTGDIINNLCRQLDKIGIRVPLVLAGIAIADGIDRLGQGGREVRCVRRYDAVVDEVCERDFYPGVPFSGRTVAGDGNAGMPYILPFGKPGKWASIPEQWQDRLSIFCLEQTIALFREIEICSGKEIAYSDLDRKVAGLADNDIRYVNALSNLLNTRRK